MTRNLFRLLLLLSLSLCIVSAVMDMLFPNLISPAITAAVENEALPPITESAWFVTVAITLVIASIICTIGLFFFRRWARIGALYTTVLFFGAYPIFGASVMSGWASALNEASLILWGAVLAVAYFSPIQDQFISSGANPAVKRDAQ